MTQPDQTTPTALSTGPWTIYRVVMGTYVGEWQVWQPHDLDEFPHPPIDRYEHIEVIPLSTLSRLVEELEERADEAEPECTCEDPEDGHTCARHDDEWEREADAYRTSAHRLRSLISQSLPKGQSDGDTG